MGNRDRRTSKFLGDSAAKVSSLFQFSLSTRMQLTMSHAENVLPVVPASSSSTYAAKTIRSKYCSSYIALALWTADRHRTLAGSQIEEPSPVTAASSCHPTKQHCIEYDTPKRVLEGSPRRRLCTMSSVYPVQRDDFKLTAIDDLIHQSLDLPPTVQARYERQYNLVVPHVGLSHLFEQVRLSAK